MTQRINSLTFGGLLAVPAVGAVFTGSISGAIGTVIKSSGINCMVTCTGDFIIGDTVTGIGIVSAVFPQDILTGSDTIISQYANSPVLDAMINSVTAAINPYQQIDDFYNDVWNIDTANTYGLGVLGRIVVASPSITLSSLTGYFEFNETGVGTAFGSVPLLGDVSATSSYTLTDQAYRLLILAKAAKNIANCSIPNINLALNKLFPGRGVIYVQILGNMQLALVVGFTLQPFELSILKNSNVFPIPVGVQLNIMSVANVFLFYETGAGTAFGTAALFGDFL